MKKKPVAIVDDTGIVKPSTSKVEFKQFIEKFKLQNPVKYEIVKAELEKKLASL